MQTVARIRFALVRKTDLKTTCKLVILFHQLTMVNGLKFVIGNMISYWEAVHDFDLLVVQYDFIVNHFPS